METTHLTWSPGNGTKYDVLVTLTDFDHTFMGHAPGTFVCTISGYPKSTVLCVSANEGFLHYTWVMEHTGLNEPDASCVTTMLATWMGIECAVCGEDWYVRSIRNPFTP